MQSVISLSNRLRRSAHLAKVGRLFSTEHPLCTQIKPTDAQYS